MLILAAPCGDGLGQDQFVDLLRRAGTYEKADRIVQQRGYRLGDHKAVRLRYLTDPAHRNVKIFLVSDGISPDEAETLGMTKVPSIDRAVSVSGLSSQTEGVYRVRDAGNLCVMSGSAD